MGVYRFAKSSVIDEVSVVVTDNGARRAYLRAIPQATADQLTDIKTYLAGKQWQCVPTFFNGESALEVRGFGSDKELLAELEGRGHTLGTPKYIKGPEDSINLTEAFKKRSLQASGLFYIVGDAYFMNYGIREKNWKDVVGGLFYGLGTQSLIWYGRNDQSDLQVQDISKKLENHLLQNRANIPEGCSLHSITQDHEKTLFQKIDDKWRRYPSEVFNFFTGMAGLFVAAAATKKAFGGHKIGHTLKDFHDMRKEGWMDIGLGMTTVAACAAGTLIPEKKRDPDEPTPTGLAWLWDKIREKPLRVTGIGLGVSTLCHAGSTVVAYKAAKRQNDTLRLGSVKSRGVFIVTNIVAEILTFLSSKGHGEGVTNDMSVQESIYSIAAELIAQQPKEMQEWHLKQVANFLQQPGILAETGTHVEQRLRADLASLHKNPWLCKEVVTQDKQEVVTAKKHTKGLTAPSGWENKIALQPHTGATVGLPT